MRVKEKTTVRNYSVLMTIVLVLVLVGGCCPKKKAPPAAPAPPPPRVVQAPAKEVVPPPVVEESLEDQARKAGALEPIYFDYDKYNLKPPAVAKLDKTADWLSKNAAVKIQIEGNCDERGTNEYNIALGDRRANSARDYLSKMGISADRLSTISYGEERPADPGHNEEAWAKNRRDDFRIVEK